MKRHFLKRFCTKYRNLNISLKGFTLIEVIVGVLIFSIVMNLTVILFVTSINWTKKLIMTDGNSITATRLTKSLEGIFKRSYHLTSEGGNLVLKTWGKNNYYISISNTSIIISSDKNFNFIQNSVEYRFSGIQELKVMPVEINKIYALYLKIEGSNFILERWFCAGFDREE